MYAYIVVPCLLDLDEPVIEDGSLAGYDRGFHDFHSHGLTFGKDSHPDFKFLRVFVAYAMQARTVAVDMPCLQMNRWSHEPVVHFKLRTEFNAGGGCAFVPYPSVAVAVAVIGRHKIESVLRREIVQERRIYPLAENGLVRNSGIGCLAPRYGLNLIIIQI